MSHMSALATNSFKIATELESLGKQLWKYLDFFEVLKEVNGWFKDL